MDDLGNIGELISVSLDNSECRIQNSELLAVSCSQKLAKS